MFDKVKIERLDDFMISMKYRNLSFIINISEKMITISGSNFDRVLVDNNMIKIKDGEGLNLFLTTDVMNCEDKN